jgi:hypothetical protein
LENVRPAQRFRNVTDASPSIAVLSNIRRSYAQKIGAPKRPDQEHQRIHRVDSSNTHAGRPGTDMHETPAIIIGMAGAAFLLGSLAPAAIEARSSSGPALGVKGDRLAAPRPAETQATVSTIEVIGLSQATVIFKSRDGAVLFRVDPEEGTTAVAKNVDLPAVTLNGEPVRSTVQQPVRSQEGSNPPTQNPRKSRTIGCEAVVSNLVKNEASRVPGLCLAQLAMPTRS